MRLDKYLQVSRLIKRRALANAFCDGGHVDINGRPAKAASAVAEGDVLELDFGHRKVRVRVLLVPERPQQGKAAASALYEEM
ncbi:MAG TPA: RNA-binding S4 domain-containing protein [Bacillota bacterium]|nr:RNA-binding S4 domain-containing protein [Bacillota bacterium]